MGVFAKGLAAAVAGVSAAVVSALCCAGPVVAVALGVSAKMVLSPTIPGQAVLPRLGVILPLIRFFD